MIDFMWVKMITKHLGYVVLFCTLQLMLRPVVARGDYVKNLFQFSHSISRNETFGPNDNDLLKEKLNHELQVSKNSLKQNPNNFDIYIEVAQRYYLLSYFEQSFGVMEKVKANLKECIVNLELAIEINPDNPKAYYQLGLTYLFSKDFKKAEVYLKKSREQFYHHGDSVQLNNVDKMLQKLARIVSFEDNLKVNPKDHKTLLNLGLEYIQIHPQEAIGFFKEYLVTYPRDFQVNLALGIIYTSMWRPEIALGYFQEAFRVQPENIEVLLALSASYTQMKQYVEALTFCKKAIGISPDNPKLYFSLGSIYLAQGTFLEEAKNSFLQAKLLYEKNGDVENSQKVANELLRVWGTNE